MDLQILLALQQFRNGAGSALTPFMLFASDLAMIGSAVICIITFWGVDRPIGYWFLTNSLGGLLVNNVIKLTACVYRPWIRCPGIKPPAKALAGATGYSFPSGHTQIAASLYGSAAVKTRKKHPALAVFCVMIIVLAGLSRNYLGVHTPQDVAVSIAIGAALIKINAVLFEKISRDQAAMYRAIITGCLFCAMCVLYFHFKPYPMDYADGALIVDPSVMKTDGYAAAGSAFGFFTGALIETRYIRFKTDGSLFRRIIRIAGGIPAAAVLFLAAKKPVYELFGQPAGHFILYMLLGLYVTALYPAVFTYIRNRFLKKSDDITQAPC